MTDSEVINAIIAREGDFVDHPSDRGGPTRFGITQATLAEHLGRPVDREDVRTLNIETARGIYAQRYLNATGIGRIEAPELRGQVLDAAVNHGPARAIRMLQRIAGTKDDGIMGEATLSALTHLDEWRMVSRYLGARCQLYGDLIAGDSSQRIFAAGWFRRLADLVK